MIYDLPDTTTGAVNKKIIDVRESGGAVALGRVMTLVIVTDEGPAEEAIRAANDASREHPCRVIALVRGNRRGANRLDAQIRVGGDAGASEVIVLRLYGLLADHAHSVAIPFLLPDAPIVAWWPTDCPDVPAQDPIGRMAQRRITDAARARSPIKALQQRAAGHAPGDSDLAWSRITLWRGLLAAALDEPPYEPVLAATVNGGSDSPSTDLLAAWLALYLKCPVRRERAAAGRGMIGVTLDRRSGAVDLQRPDAVVATLTQPGQPDRRIALAPRQDRDCLAEELRRLDPDDVFGEVVTRGLALLASDGATKKAPVKAVPRKTDRAAPAAQAHGATASTSDTLAGGDAEANDTAADTTPEAAAKATPAKKAGAKKAGAKKATPVTKAAPTKAGATKAGATKAGAKKAGATKKATPVTKATRVAKATAATKATPAAKGPAKAPARTAKASPS
ncbi:MAG TPA: glucose-6-phosphate dehydrogenase assembly protein OpcA [Kineosporiaceae bacterium]